MLAEFTEFTKSPIISEIKGAFVQQKLQLICPEITGSELWLCVPLQLVLVKVLERKRGENGTHGREKRRQGRSGFKR